MEKKIRIDPEAYVLDPIQPEELASIERSIGRPIPAVLRDLVGKVGFLQNAIGGDWPRNKKEFIEIQDAIPEGHVAFLDDGAGNYHIVSPEDRLLFWDHETGELNEEESAFQEFVGDLLLDPEPIETLGWHVQMSFAVNDDFDVIKALSESFEFETIGPWNFKDTSSAGVSTYLREFVGEGKVSSISKQIYAGWTFDIIYFNKIIKIRQIEKHRQIFERFESNPSLGFTLIDYGILPLDLK